MIRRALATLALVSWSSAAGAQDFGGDFFAPDGFGLIEGTTRYEAARQASLTNAQVYGAVGAFDRYVIPLLGAESEEGHSGHGDCRRELGSEGCATHKLAATGAPTPVVDSLRCERKC